MVNWDFNSNMRRFFFYLCHHAGGIREVLSIGGEVYGGIGGMILSGENRSIRIKFFPSTTFSTTNPTWTGLESKPGLDVEAAGD